MSEFNNRVAAQRELLGVVNSREWPKEDLFSLSSKAIDRWASRNRIDPDCQLLYLIYSASEKLFFLANKSQEQVSDEYRAISRGFSSILESIKIELANQPSR